MDALIKKAARLLRDEDGPTATEYAVVVSLVIITAFASVSALGSVVAGKFELPALR
jgi:Flp pilus assembly pilin Flp